MAEKHRQHPVFAGLDTSQLILLTTLGGNALADFYGTAGPHGELLAEGNAGLGERPLVEYQLGAGRVIFVGWRLPDFTTKTDPHRPNLERLFGNLLRYLAAAEHEPRQPGPARDPLPLRSRAGCAAACVPPSLRQLAVGPEVESGWTAVAVSDAGVAQAICGRRPARARSGLWGATEFSSSRSASRYSAARSPSLNMSPCVRRSRPAMTGGTARRSRASQVVKPTVTLVPAPLKPLQMPELEQSVLLGRSPFMAPGDGLGDIEPAYEPIEDGGFRIAGSTRRLNRPIAHGQNRVWTGDVPVFRMDTTTGNGSYASDKIFPLWPRPDIQSGSTYPSMGTLRLAVPGSDGNPQWLDTIPGVTTTFRPGYTEYEVSDAAGGWTAKIVVAPAMDFHGMVCRVQFDRPMPLHWQYRRHVVAGIGGQCQPRGTGWFLCANHGAETPRRPGRRRLRSARAKYAIRTGSFRPAGGVYLQRRRKRATTCAPPGA